MHLKKNTKAGAAIKKLSARRELKITLPKQPKH